MERVEPFEVRRLLLHNKHRVGHIGCRVKGKMGVRVSDIKRDLINAVRPLRGDNRAFAICQAEHLQGVFNHLRADLASCVQPAPVGAHPALIAARQKLGLSEPLFHLQPDRILFHIRNCHFLSLHCRFLLQSVQILLYPPLLLLFSL